jgi:hypothetical protein
VTKPSCKVSLREIEAIWGHFNLLSEETTQGALRSACTSQPQRVVKNSIMPLKSTPLGGNLPSFGISIHTCASSFNNSVLYEPSKNFLCTRPRVVLFTLPPGPYIFHGGCIPRVFYCPVVCRVLFAYYGANKSSPRLGCEHRRRCNNLQR